MREEISLLPRQQVAMSCPAREILYGGAKGGGKSHYLALCPIPLIEAAHRRSIETGRKQPHVRIVFFRKNLDDLKDISVKMQRVYPIIDPAMGIDGWNKVEKTWTFTSGATVQLRHLDGPDDHLGWNGQELMLLCFDQVEEIPYEQYSFLAANVRTADAYYKPYLGVRSTANPGGRHGAWVKQRFIEPCREGGKILRDEVTLTDGTKMVVTRAFIPAKLKDNHFLASDGVYEANLRSTLSAELVQRYIDGDWDVIEGARFASLVRPGTFQRSFPVPASWDIGFGLDWGAANPACTLWCAYDDGNDRVYVIDELHTPGISGSRYAEHMLDKVRHQKWSSRVWGVEDFYGLFDKEAADITGAEGATPADVIAMSGFRIFPAQKSRKAGITQILERLQPLADGQPGLVIFEDRCPHLKAALTSCATAKDDPEDYDKRDQGAHAIDALRFYLMDKPVRPRAETNNSDHQMRLWDQYIKAAKRGKQHEAPERDW